MLAAVFSRDRFAQRFDSLDVRIFGHAFAQRVDGSGFDVFRSIEIRFSGGKVYDIDSFGAKLTGLRGDR